MSLADCLKKIKVSKEVADEINSVGLVRYEAGLSSDLESLRTQLTEAGLDVPAVPVPERLTTRELFQSSGFVSSVEGFVSNIKQEKGSGEQFLAQIRKAPGVKEDEISWIGLDEFLKGKKSVTKQEMVDYIEQNQVQVEEVALDDSTDNLYGERAVQAHTRLTQRLVEKYGTGIRNKATAEEIKKLDDLNNRSTERAPEGLVQKDRKTKFSSYTLPGGENYREVLMTLPVQQRDTFEDYLVDYRERFPHSKADETEIREFYDGGHKVPRAGSYMSEGEVFRSPHFDQTNVLAHLRLNDRTDADGNKVLFIEEIQSDWGQSLRKSAPLRQVAEQGDVRKFFNNFFGGQEMPSGISLNEMDAGMLAASKHGKIGEAIISLVPVNVVNNLSGGQSAAKKFFNDPSVILKTSSVDARAAWFTGVVNASREVGTTLRAKLSDAIETGVDVELFPTLMASDLSAREIIGLLDPKSIFSLADPVAKKGVTQAATGQAEFLSRGLPTGITTDSSGGGSTGLYSKTGTTTIAETLDWHNKVLSGVGKKTVKYKPTEGVPSMPLEKTWHEMALRRAIQMAAEGDYDSIAWTTGEQQNERFDLSKKVSLITYQPKSKALIAYDLDGKQVINEEVPQQNLEDYIGKDVAVRLINDGADKDGDYKLSGEDLKVGGEGMKGFYDKILPTYAKKFGKKFGAKVETTEITGQAPATDDDAKLLSDLGVKGTGSNTAEVHSLPITDEMRESAKQGVALFQGKQGSINFTDMNNIILNLFKSENASTFLHEMGHLYLEIMSKYSQLETANQSLKDDMTAIHKWLDSAPGQEFTRDQHEKFARTYEQYLKEGKAPSVNLMDAFASFGSWMLQIYKKSKVPGSDLAPEIRDIFDRMLATEEEINEARNVSRMHKVFADLESSGMTEEEYNKYTESIERSRDSQHSELVVQTYREEKRTATKWWNKEKFEEQKIIIEQLDGDPVWAARYIIQEGRMPSGAALPENMPDDLKLSKDGVAEIEHVEGLKYLPGGNRMYRKEGGVHPDALAEVLGFDSGSELISALMSMPKNEEGKFLTEKQFAKVEADARMKQRYGDILNDGTLQEEAMMRVHSESQARVIQREISQLAKLSGASRAPSNKIVKEAAKRAIQNKAVGKILSHRHYLNAETRAAEQAMAAAAEGDMAAAFEAKQRQLLNFHMYREARNASEKIDKMAIYLKDKQRKVINPNNVNPDFIKQVKAILAHVNFGARIGEKKFNMLSSETLKNWAEAQTKKYGASFHISPELDRALTKNHFKDMTLEELGGLHDTVKNILSQGRRYSKAQQKQFETIAWKMADSVGKNAKKEMVSKRNPRWFDHAFRGGRMFAAEHRQLLSLAIELDGGKTNGLVYQNIYQIIKHTDDKYIDRSMSAAKEINKILKQYTKRERIGFYRSTHIKSLGESLDLNARLAFALNMGNAGNVDAMMNEYSDAQIEEILGTLTDKDWDVVEAIWAHIDQYKEDLLSLQERVTGVRPSEVQAVPFTTSSGRVVSGGYYPLAGDPNRDDAGGKAAKKDIEERSTLSGFLNGGHTKASTKTGAEIERKGFGKDRKVWLDLSVTFRHIDGVIKDIEMREAVGDVYRFINHKGFSNAVASAKGKEFHDAMERWLENVVGGNNPPITPIEKVILHARKGASIAEMGFSLRTMLQQPFGITMTIVLIGETNTAKGVAAFAWDRGAAAKRVTGLSKFMRNRAATFNRDVKDASNLFGIKGVADEVINSSFWGIQMLDLAVSIPTWLGAEQKALDDGLTGQDVIDYADDIVQRSQGTGLSRGLANIQQGAAWKKMFTMFMTFFQAYYNVQTDLIKTTDFKSPKQLLKYAKNQIWVTVIPALLVDYLFNGGPDDDEGIIKWAGGSLLGFAFGGIVLARDAANSLGSGYDYQTTPAGGLAEYPLTLIKQSAQGEIDAAWVKALLMSTGYVAHVPGMRTATRATSYIDKEGTDELDTFEGWWRLLVMGPKK